MTASDNKVTEAPATEAPAPVEETPKVSKIKGKTMGTRFDKVSTPTLRAWLKYWSDADRVKADDPELKAPLATREDHVKAITAEIEARGKTA